MPRPKRTMSSEITERPVNCNMTPEEIARRTEKAAAQERRRLMEASWAHHALAKLYGGWALDTRVPQFRGRFLREAKDYAELARISADLADAATEKETS